MEEVNDYPSLVDAVYTVVRQISEDQSGLDLQIPLAQIATALNIEAQKSEAVLGIDQAMLDLVDFNYCKRHGTQPALLVSLSLDAPKTLPSMSMHPPSLTGLPSPLVGEVLKYFHERTVKHIDGVTFYSTGVRIPHNEALQALFPENSDIHTAKLRLGEAVEYLKNYGFIKGFTTSGNYCYHPTLRGACCIKSAQ